MTSILENELVRKYFSCYAEKTPCLVNGHPGHTALRILRAMQEPIRAGIRYLELSQFIEPVERISGGQIYGDFHPMYLTLPSRFQPSTEKKMEHIHRGSCECGIDLVLRTFGVIETQPPTAMCTCHYTDERVEDPKCPRHKPAACCAFHADNPQLKSRCSEDIEPTGKCSCPCDHSTGCSVCHAPDPAIEAKIKELCYQYWNHGCGPEYMVEDEIRELVELARRSDR